MREQGVRDDSEVFGLGDLVVGGFVERKVASHEFSFSKLSRKIVNHKQGGQHSCVQCDREEVCYAVREVAPGQQDELTAKH